MINIPIVVVIAGSVAGLTYMLAKPKGGIGPRRIGATGASIPPTKKVLFEMPKPENLIPVQLGADTWLVSPDYIGPIGINEAAIMAAANGMELPSPALVDAIWRQADLKLLPMPRNNIISDAVFASQRQRIVDQVAGRPFTLLGGSFKDVVVFNGKPQIYGWHVEDGKTVAGVPLLRPFTAGPGKVIQPLSGSRHDSPGPVGFKDYSQGLRLVRKVPRDSV